MPEVRGAVHGWAAQVDVQFALLAHLQFAHFARNGVVQMQHDHSLEAALRVKPSCAPIQ